MGGKPKAAAPPPPPPRREVPDRVEFKDVELPEKKKAKLPGAVQRGVVPANGEEEVQRRQRQTLG